MWVKYIVPEDGDDFNHPNVFKIQVTANQDVNAIPLESIVKNFPLPGEFSFRFLKNLPNTNMQVWLDMSESKSFVPTSDNGIFLKASRNMISSNSFKKISITEEKITPNLTKLVPEMPKPPAVATINKPAPKVDSLLNFEDDNQTSSIANNSAHSSVNSFAESDLLGLSSNPPTHNSNNLSNMSNSAIDLLGLESTPVSSSPRVNDIQIPNSGFNNVNSFQSPIPAMNSQRPFDPFDNIGNSNRPMNQPFRGQQQMNMNMQNSNKRF